MVLIAENLHIISKTAKEAIIRRDESYILNIVKKVNKNGLRAFDLNIGPAKGGLSGAFEYLTKLIGENFGDNVRFSFDTSNFGEMEKGFKSITPETTENSFLNSVCADDEKMEKGFKIASEFNSNVIALTFDPKNGISKTAEERMELGLSIYENALVNGISEEKLYFDPLVLPISVAQETGAVVLDTIRMLKEALPGVKTVIGLSNISNGSPKEMRPLINRVFLALSMGAGLDGAIVDGLDDETIRVHRMIKENTPTGGVDTLYCSLYNALNTFSDIDDIEFDKDDSNQVNIMKCARILMNKEIYSHSFIKA